MPVEEFDELVADALDELAEGPLLQFLDNVVILVEDQSPDDPELLALYDGIALTERENYSGVLPDRITLFRLPLCAWCEDEDDLYEEVVTSIVHEVAHFHGMSEEEIHALGYG